MTPPLHLIAVTLLLATQQTYSLKPDLRFGAVDGDAAFSSIGGVAMDRHNNIYVTDVTEKRVKVFDARGKYLRSIGRPGRGPGDLESPSTISLAAETLRVTDFSGRTSFFNAVTGRFLRVVEMPPIRGNTAGSGYSPQSGVIRILQNSPISSSDQSLFITRQSEVRKLDTLLTIPRKNSWLSILDANNHPVYGTTQPFTDDPIAAIAPNKPFIVVVTFPPPAKSASASYVVTLYDVPALTTAGPPRVRQRKSFGYKPQPLTETQIDQYLKRMSGQERGPYFPKDGDGATRKALYRPKWLRPVSAVRVLSSGSIWLRDRGPSSEPSRWTILKPDLTPHGTVTIPTKYAYPVAFEGNHVWLVEYDEDEVPYLVRARLTPASKQPQE